MLSATSKTTSLPEKQLLLLGGTPTQQTDLLEHLSPPPSAARSRHHQTQQQQHRKPPVSNRYALGYTYQDVLDADQDDVLARLNVYTLSEPAAEFGRLLRPLFTERSVKETLVAIVLDWAEPWRWARQLRLWVRLLRAVLRGVDEEVKIAMEENMEAWKGRGGALEGQGQTVGGAGVDGEAGKGTARVLGPGEWDEGLGVALSVVCVGSERIEALERDVGWQDEQFDFLGQWLRCVLLKHGGSLVYTSGYDANGLRGLVHASLGIQSLLKRETVKPEYIEREKILIPPGWDSWGKIRTLREGTELEAISDAWSVEIQGKLAEKLDDDHEEEANSAVGMYEITLPKPSTGQTAAVPTTEAEIGKVPTVQEFLSEQLAKLEAFKVEDEQAAIKAAGKRGKISSTGQGPLLGFTGDENTPRMQEHIGPYQMNVNGIDLDVEEATRRLKEREAERAASKDTPAASGTATAVSKSGVTSGGASGMTTPTRKPAAGGSGEDGKASNEAMSAFFQNLIKKDRRGAGTSTGNGTPQRTGSPAPKQ
jgi:dynein light intermediate chain 1, cytosolic